MLEWMEVRTLDKKAFPAQLLEIPEPPNTLWIRGCLPPPETKLLTIIGSLALTRYGRETCEYLLQGLAGYPLSIVCGLTLGTDICAHRTALETGLHTIALPASGIANEALTLHANFGLAQDIVASGGALLSENPPSHIARTPDFPTRNRLLVGLAHAVLVIEAGAKSGTLVMARLAADYNRELLCVPHRIGDPHATAAHTFLRQGATQVTEPAHILEALSIKPHEPSDVHPFQLSHSEQELYDLLIEPLPRDELIRRVNMPPHATLTTLGKLELKGLLIERLGLWQRTAPYRALDYI